MQKCATTDAYTRSLSVGAAVAEETSEEWRKRGSELQCACAFRWHFLTWRRARGVTWTRRGVRIDCTGASRVQKKKHSMVLHTCWAVTICSAWFPPGNTHYTCLSVMKQDMSKMICNIWIKFGGNVGQEPMDKWLSFAAGCRSGSRRRFVCEPFFNIMIWHFGNFFF